MQARVTIVDYGIGNVKSVANAFGHFDVPTTLCETHKQIVEADYLVLPGVGAFGVGMQELKKRGLDEAIKEFVTKERPFLGICLGMQMMFDDSEEFGHHQGLGLISGHVKKIPEKNAQGEAAKIPHIGWAKVRPPDTRSSWENTLLSSTEFDDYVYFVHSYQGHVDCDQEGIAYANYNGISILGAVSKGHLHGCQFHPEKSAQTGLGIIKRFTES